jgi:hypothetical protein
MFATAVLLECQLWSSTGVGVVIGAAAPGVRLHRVVLRFGVCRDPQGFRCYFLFVGVLSATFLDICLIVSTGCH